MTEEQAERMIIAIEGLNAGLEKLVRPVVIVTNSPDCELVRNYHRRGYPVLYQGYEPLEDATEVFRRFLEADRKAATTQS